mmetsp:Transcript_4862/g.8721  ORF Transcript_4862/g.8721 Transcript_4862/m.8721 type:complete len:104 (+) Transcript_4862:833-1144(+)
MSENYEFLRRLYSTKGECDKAEWEVEGDASSKKSLMLVLCGCVCFGDCGSCFAEKKEDDILWRGIQPHAPTSSVSIAAAPEASFTLHLVTVEWNGAITFDLAL